ncbi:MAG: 3-dehydroquinate synthase [Oscillospiraceae bacterium]|nr:3-dehydroquinate synthase [Oscillospiraceae bacterium]
MTTIQINTSRCYAVLIGTGLLADLGTRVREVLPRAQIAAVVTDDTVGALYLPAVEASLRRAGLESRPYSVRPGEASKNGAEYLSLLSWLAETQLTHTDVVIALGGGVVGDLAGFAAATYRRGVPFVQVPTTLLAMVDASVGGKTGIDLPQGKNLAGAFHQPALVVCDPKVLETLDETVFRDGCAEVIKCGMLGSGELLDQLLTGDIHAILPSVIAACVDRKRVLVEEDEFDTGARRLLGFGHTVAHALERLHEYEISHGLAVAIGMAIDTRAALGRGICPPDCLSVLERLLARYGLPSRTDWDAASIAEVAVHDKKRGGDQITFAVPVALGTCELQTIPLAALRAWIEAGLES